MKNKLLISTILFCFQFSCSNTKISNHERSPASEKKLYSAACVCRLKTDNSIVTSVELADISLAKSKSCTPIVFRREFNANKIISSIFISDQDLLRMILGNLAKIKIYPINKDSTIFSDIKIVEKSFCSRETKEEKCSTETLATYFTNNGNWYVNSELVNSAIFSELNLAALYLHILFTKSKYDMETIEKAIGELFCDKPQSAMMILDIMFRS